MGARGGGAFQAGKAENHKGETVLGIVEEYLRGQSVWRRPRRGEQWEMRPKR